MANATITQRISLAGGKEVKAQLEALGAAGSEAGRKLEAAFGATAQAGTALNKTIVVARKSTDAFGSSISGLKDKFGKLNNELSVFGLGLGIAAAGAVFRAFGNQIRAATQAADEHVKASQSLGLTIREYGRLRFGLAQSGVEAEKFSTAFSKFNRNILDAKEGVGDGAKAFVALGVSIIDADGKLRPAEQILGDIAERFSRMPDGVEKSGYAMQLFGRAGASMIPFLNSGRAGIQAMGDTAERIGIVFTVAEGKIAEAMNDALERVGMAAAGIRNHLMLVFAPQITQAADRFTEFLATNKEALMAYGQAVASATAVILEGIATLGSGLLTAGGIISAGVQAVLDPLNAIFGTDFTAQGAIVLAILLRIAAGYVSISAAIAAAATAQGLFAAGAALLSAHPFVAIGAAVLALAGVIRVYWDDIKSGAAGAGEAIVNAFTSALGVVTNLFSGLWDFVKSVFGGILDFLSSVISKAAAAGSAAASAGGEAGGFAGGGHVRGRGTSTSDNIPAWLSPGEFVQRAAAVRKYGVGFMQAVNSLRFDPSGFAMGGLVSAPALAAIPARGGGAASQAMRPLSLTIGGEEFAGLLSPADVAEKMIRYAATRNIRRAGRKPGWVR